LTFLAFPEQDKEKIFFVKINFVFKVCIKF
jgi:hypothetical protein